jgi:hypothetical protein
MISVEEHSHLTATDLIIGAISRDNLAIVNGVPMVTIAWVHEMVQKGQDLVEKWIQENEQVEAAR